MEWTSPRPQHQFAFPQQFQSWHHYEDDEDEKQDQTPYNAMLQNDRFGSTSALLPPRPASSLKTELPCTLGNDGGDGVTFQPLSALGMPQLEEATEFQPFYSSQNAAYPSNAVLAPSLPPLPPPPTQQQQRQIEQQQYDGQLSMQFSSQFPEFPTEPASFYPVPTPLPSTPMPQASSRPALNYFPEGIPSLHSVNSSLSVLPSSFGSLEQKQKLSQRALEDQEDQDNDFDNSMVRDTSPACTMFNSELPMAPTDPDITSRSMLTLPIGTFPTRTQSSIASTPPDYSPVITPLGRARRGSGLSEPFTQMATTHEPKFSPDKRKLCCVEGCKSQARAFNRCKRHGGSKRCSSPGCTKSVQSRGLCIRHGGGSRCQEVGCTRASQSHGRCKMHGGGRPCIVAGCEKKAHLKRLCRKHGGGTKCVVSGCDKWAQRQGMCMTHSKVVGAQIVGDTTHFEPNSPPSPDSSPSTSLRIFSDAV